MSIQEDVNHRSISLSVRAAKLTGRTLLKVIRAYLRHRKNQQLRPDIPQGKQTVKQLAKQGQGMTSLDINDKDIGTITLNGHTFLETSFLVEQTDIENTFLKYSSYTVEDILQKDKFRSLKQEVYQRYHSMLKLNISEYLEQLVETKDKFYFNFLNKNGADRFCVFKLTDINILNLKGLYLYTHNGKVSYIGRCKYSFGKRFNVNYGKIHPKNCFKDGQSTNTHINSLMNKYHENIKIYLLVLNEDEVIERLEREFIQSLKPEWNRTN